MSKRRARSVKAHPTPPRFTRARLPIVLVLIAGALTAGFLAIRAKTGATEPTTTTASNQAVSHTSAAFLPTVGNATGPSEPAPAGMVWIPGGEFSMGAQDPTDMRDAVGMQATVSAIDAFEDCKQFYERNFDAMVDTDAYAADHRRFLTADVIGLWIAWNLFGRRPNTDAGYALARSIGVLVNASFADWWKPDTP